LIERDIGAAARYADLTVIVRPSHDWQHELRTRMLEGVLFAGGRPLLLMPPRWQRSAIGRNVVVAWNGKREAARALADASPFLERADTISIVTVDAGHLGSGLGHGSADRIALHLARRGQSAACRHIGDLGLGEAHALFAEANALSADLVVMGGYGRSRLDEFIFGGVTHQAINTAKIPIFMSH
jgi:nucleotide-binding universal stress UspA family protein